MTKTRSSLTFRRFEEIIGVMFLGLIFLTVALQVVSRFVFKSPPFWTEELSRYLFVWMVCVGSAEVVRARGHITMDMVPMLLPNHVSKILQIVMNILIFATLIVLVWYGNKGAVRADKVMSIAIGVPESFLYGALPVGAALMAFRTFGLIVSDTRSVFDGSAKPKQGD